MLKFVSQLWMVALTAIILLNLKIPAPTTYAQENRLSIIGSTTMIADVVGRVAGDAADVTPLMGYGVDPHAYEPSAQDIVALDEADVVFINGANFEEGLIAILEEAAPENLVTISDCVAILPFGSNENPIDAIPTDDMSSIADQCASHFETLAALGVEVNQGSTLENGTEPLGLLYETNCTAGHHDDSADTESGHEEGNCDPHLWTDVRNVMLWTLMARDVLSEADPANAAIYATNADAYLVELVALDAEIAGLLASVPQENRVLITNHETLGYLAARYGYQIVGSIIPGGGTANEPSAEDVAALIETVLDYGVPAIFTENTVNAALAEQIAAETGASVYQLYSDSLTDADGPAHTYIDYMRANATAIMTALTEK
ncbi:MAG: metal ABC transporter substrate-binding protein [Anaerolineae bacterium]|nr:metal ABC transporter substrate-binding protein [Anaerolineae bacterium]